MVEEETHDKSITDIRTFFYLTYLSLHYCTFCEKAQWKVSGRACLKVTNCMCQRIRISPYLLLFNTASNFVSLTYAADISLFTLCFLCPRCLQWAESWIPKRGVRPGGATSCLDHERLSELSAVLRLQDCVWNVSLFYWSLLTPTKLLLQGQVHWPLLDGLHTGHLFQWWTL